MVGNTPEKPLGSQQSFSPEPDYSRMTARYRDRLIGFVGGEPLDQPEAESILIKQKPPEDGSFTLILPPTQRSDRSKMILHSERVVNFANKRAPGVIKDGFLTIRSLTKLCINGSAIPEQPGPVFGFHTSPGSYFCTGVSFLRPDAIPELSQDTLGIIDIDSLGAKTLAQFVQAMTR